MASFFSGPKTPVTDAIEAATSDGHSIEDIGFHLQICDMVNESDAAAKDAARILKKKLEARRPLSLVKTLTVLETCVKNCNKRFHVYIAEKSFVAALEKFVVGKNAVGGIAREKALGLIQAWADAFKHDPALGLIRELYIKLLGEGVEFPAQNLDDIVPIVTPRLNTSLLASQPPASSPQRQAAADASLSADERMARELDRQFREEEAAAQANRYSPPGRGAVTPTPATAHAPAHSHTPSSAAGGAQGGYPAPSPHRGHGGATRIVQRVQQIAPGERVLATEQQLKKLRADLAIVRQNATLLMELVRGLAPTERARDNELVSEVATTCASMQRRVMELCDQVTNEDLIVELLTANDLLNDAQKELATRTATEAPPPSTRVEGGHSAAPPSHGRSAPAQYSAWLPGGQSQRTPPRETAPPPHHAGPSMPTRAPPQPPGGGGGGGVTAAAVGGDTSRPESPGFDMFAQTRHVSMSDRLRTGPGYVTGEERSLDDHGTFSARDDSSLGAAMYSHMGPSDDGGGGPSYMEVAPSFMPRSSQGSTPAAPPGSLYATPGPAVEPEYAEIGPSPDRRAVELPGQVESPTDDGGRGGGASGASGPIFYDAGGTRRLTSPERERLDAKQDALFTL